MSSDISIAINAADVNADLVALFLNPHSPFALDPIRGDSYKFYGTKEPVLELKGRNIYPTSPLMAPILRWAFI